MSRKIKHEFEEQKFNNLTKCFVCDEMIENEVISNVLDNTPNFVKNRLPEDVVDRIVPRGVGSTCKVCGVNVHSACAEHINTPCAKVYHQFEMQSYPPFTKMCYACGTTLHGLFNQGYRCTACGIDCHPGCRTNVNIKFCAASPQVHLLKEEDLEDDGDSKGPLYQFVGEAADQDSPTSSSSKRKSWAKSIAKRMSNSALSDKKSNKSKKGDKSKGGSSVEQIPSSFVDMGKELRKLHTQTRAVAMTKAVRWENEDLPRLKASRIELVKHKNKLRLARDKVARKVESRTRKRVAHYHAFTMKILTKHCKKKKKEAEQISAQLIDDFSTQRCREMELLDQLESLAKGNSAALKLIDEERRSGLCRPDGKLETSLEQLEMLHDKVKIATQSLEAVRREIFFPRWRTWFARLGFEGTYVALGRFWLELFQGSMAVRVAMLPGKKKGKLAPTLVIGLGGHDTKYAFGEMGASPGAHKSRQKQGGGGMQLIARIERLSVSGSALPVSFTLDQLSLDLEFFLNIEMEYIPSKKRNIRGVWRLKPDAFSLSFKRFELNFKGGSLNIPDQLLRTVVKSLMTTGAKAFVKSVVPPELGDYILFMHTRTPDDLGHAKDNEDLLRYHGRIDIASEVDLETLDYVMESSAEAPTQKGGSGFAVNLTKKVVKGAARMAAAATGVKSGKRHVFKDIPVLERLTSALGLEPRQLDLFVRAQQELGLTRDSIFPDDSLMELGMKALYSNVQDIQSTVEAANRLGMKVLAGDILSSQAPLRTLLDLIQYILLYFGPASGGSSVHTQRMIALWQGALDRAQKKMMSSNSFKTKYAEFRSSTSSIKSTGSDGMGSSRKSAGPVQRIIFTDLIDRVVKIARKRIISHLEVVHADMTLGLEHLLKVGRDKMLRVAEKTRGGSAMVFQLRHTNKRSSKELGDEEALALENEGDDDDDFQLESDGSFRGAMTRAHSEGEDGADADDVDVESLLLSSSSSTSKYGKKYREKIEQINTKYAKQSALLQKLRQHYLNAINFEIYTEARDGKFDYRVMDIDIVSPVDFRLLMNSSVFSNRSRINNWPWRRVMRAHGHEQMQMAMIKLLDPGTGEFSSPDDEGTLRVDFSAIQSRIEAADKPLKDVMEITMKPLGVTGSKMSRAWQEPGKVQFHWKGAEDLRFLATMDVFHLHGGLMTLQDYAGDLLDWAMQAVNDERQKRMAQYILNSLIRYARLNTFYGKVSSNVAAISTDQDTFVRFHDAGSKIAGSSSIEMNVVHDMDEFFNDIAVVMTGYMTDPLNDNK